MRHWFAHKRAAETTGIVLYGISVLCLLWDNKASDSYISYYRVVVTFVRYCDMFMNVPVVQLWV